MKNQAIQGLRVVFLIGIFLKHLHDSIGFPYIIDFGARGVEFFFVLSGFLTGIKINYKELSLQSCFSFLFHKLRKFYPNLIDGFLDWFHHYSSDSERKNLKNKVLFNIANPKDYYWAIVLYIAGMTDKFAIDTYHEIIGF